MTNTQGTVRAAFWCGSYTPPHGTGGGVEVLAADSEGVVRDHGLLAKADSPSFLATHPRLPLLYTVGEFEQRVRVWRRDGASLRAVGGPKTAGDAVCHIAADPLGRFVVASCWGDGQVICYELDDEGLIRSRRVAPAAVDPHGGPDRVSRAHQAVVLADGRIVTTDLGYDLLRVWRYVPAEGLKAESEVVLPAGAGPRHLAVHESGCLYVITELSAEVCVVAPDTEGRYELVARGPAVYGSDAADDTGAEISIDASGRWVHTTVRGSDRLVTHAVEDGGRRLEPIAETGCGGVTPRHHLELGGMLYVANQGSDAVVTFRVDHRTGLPGEPVATVAVGSPSCIVPL